MRVGLLVGVLWLCAAVSGGIPGNMGQDHVGLTVTNVQAATDFLIDVFDCVFDWEVRREPHPNAGERGWDKVFGLHPESYLPHVVMVKCGDHHLAQYVELFEWNSPDQVVPSNSWPKFVDIGHSYISFTVKDIHAVVEYIKSRNIPGVRFIQDPPMDFPLRGETCTSTFMTTPWNMWIELAQWSISGPKGTVIRKLREQMKHDHVSADYSDHEPYALHQDVGKKVQDLETPSFFVDLDLFEKNLDLMASRILGKNIVWRPPVKAHRCPELAKRFIARGATGVIVLKIGEAEQFADGGIEDIMIANEVVGPEKLKRLAKLAKRVKRLRVAVDNQDNLKDISAIARAEGSLIEVVIDININMNRCGVLPEHAVPLAKLAVELQNERKADTDGGIKFVGIMGYEGHTPILPPEEKTIATNDAHSVLAKAKKLIEDAGIRVDVVSAGGSSNYIDALNAGVINEIQAGGGGLSDLLYVNKAGLGPHGHVASAFVLTTIMSLPTEGGRAMGDAGFKIMGWHPFGGLPQPRDRADIEVTGLSAEHTKFKLIGNSDIRLGDKVVLVPGYCDAMGFLQQQIYAVRNGVVQYVWPVITGAMQ